MEHTYPPLAPFLSFESHKVSSASNCKGGKEHLLPVMNYTLALMAKYLRHVHTHPSPCLPQHLKHPSRAMTAEVLAPMQLVGIYTSNFKAHFLHGATATNIMAHGASQVLSCQRGG